MAKISKSNIKSSNKNLFDSKHSREKATTIRTLIQKGANVNARDSKGCTPLLIASKYGLKTVVKLLLDSGADAYNFDCRFNRTLLHYASGHGWPDIVQYLLKSAYVPPSMVLGDCPVSSEMSACPIINARDFEGRTALHLSSLRGHLEVVSCLVENGASLVVKNKDAKTALHDASRNGHTKVVKFLLGRGANFNTRDKCGSTALHEASEGGHLGVVKCLVAQGTDFNIRNECGHTALHVASCRQHPAVVKYLLGKGADLDARDGYGQTALLMAAKCLSVDVVILLINSGASVDCCDCDKRTALHYAAQYGCIEMAQYLVKRVPVPPFIVHQDYKDNCEGSTCPTIHARDINGRTAFNIAAFQGHLEVVKFLVAEGADLDGRNEDGKTGLHEASYFGHFEVVKFLVEAKADLSIRTKIGNTVLHEAFIHKNLDVIKFLLEQGADINMKSDLGTLLLIAARSGSKDVVELLLNSGANLDDCDKNGKTILHHAARNGWIKMVQFILNRISDLDARDSKGDTALLSACRVWQLDSVKYLLQAGARWDITSGNGSLPLNCTREGYSRGEFIKSFIAAGAYLTPDDYFGIVKRYPPQIHLLQDVKFCCQAIVNKFNACDLPALYELPASVCLPRIEKMVIASNSEVAQGIERTVKLEIQRNEYCNVLEVHPISLSFFSVRSVLKYYNKKTPVQQNQFKRLVALRE